MIVELWDVVLYPTVYVGRDSGKTSDGGGAVYSVGLRSFGSGGSRLIFFGAGIGWLGSGMSELHEVFADLAGPRLRSFPEGSHADNLHLVFARHLRHSAEH
jgi:hypothetical protein